MPTYPTTEQANVMAEEIELPFFVYGTLRPNQGAHGIWEGVADARYDGKCRVDGFRLVSNGAFPYAVPTEGMSVFGCLIFPHIGYYNAIRLRFDRLEGVPSHYTRERTTVHTAEGDVVAWIYVPAHPDWYANMEPIETGDWVRQGATVTHDWGDDPREHGAVGA